MEDSFQGGSAATTTTKDFAQQQHHHHVRPPATKTELENNTNKKIESIGDDKNKAEESMNKEVGTILPKGTVLYWRFDIGSYWGQIVSFNAETELYETIWDDGSHNSTDKIYNFSKQEVDAMSSYAQYTLKAIPKQFLQGTPVIRYFANDNDNNDSNNDEEQEEEDREGQQQQNGGSWWNGLIVDHDTNHYYTIEWKDGTLEQWDPLSTVAMVQDAEYFLHKKKKKKKSMNPIMKKNGEKEQHQQSDDIKEDGGNSRFFGDDNQEQIMGKTSSHSKMSAGSKKKKKIKNPNQSSNKISFDPTSFPPTAEGLGAFLKIIDEGNNNTMGSGRPSISPPPLLANGGGNGTYGRQRQQQQSSRPQQAVYHATNVTIDASTTREFTIPIFEAHSTVDYTITVHNHDIKFAILWHDPSTSKNNNTKKKNGSGGVDTSFDTDDTDDDSENDDIELVEQRTIYAVNTKPLQPVEGDDEDDDDARQQHSNRGRFALDESIPVPTTLYLEFDNSYSWFRGKTVSYQVTVNSPSSQAMIQRATEAVPLVLQALQESKTNVALQESVVQTASQQTNIVQQDNAAFARQVESRQNLVFQAENAADEADQKHYEAETNLHHQHQLLENQDLYIQEIDQKILDLQHQRAHLVKQKAELEVDIIASKEQLKSFETISSVKRTEAERIKMDMCDLQIEILNRDQQYGDVEKQQSKAKSNLQSAITRMQFLKRLAEELQKRLNNK